MTSISGAQCDELLATFDSQWFRLESRDGYAVGDELAEFQLYLAGSPRLPSEVSWWQEWLDQMAALTSQGKVITRVRVIPDEGPTNYQSWLAWADPAYRAAGITIRYITRSRAKKAGLPINSDWSLLDGKQVIVHEFNEENQVAGWDLLTDPGTVARFGRWADIAMRNAVLLARTA